MPEPELHSSASAPSPVKAGLGVEDIRHIPARERELRLSLIHISEPTRP